MPRAFGGNHDDIHVCRRLDLPEVNVEAVGKEEHVPRLQVGTDFALENGLLHFIGQQNHYPIGGSGSIRHRFDH